MELIQSLRVPRVNPEPITYWGDDELLRNLFSGSSQISSEDGRNKMVFNNNAHELIVANPEMYAAASDADGVNGVHACAVNGYLSTLRCLVECGGADPFSKTTFGGLDAEFIARRRGHRGVIQYLAELQKNGRKLFKRIRARLEAARRGKDVPTLPPPPTISSETSKERRARRAAEARARALKDAHEAMLRAKTTDGLPRIIWRNEWVQIDEKQSRGYYPRKVF